MSDLVDWFRVVSDLQRAGMSHWQQARECGASRRSVGNWQTGVCEPSFSKGYRLLDTYKSVFGSTPERQDFAQNRPL